MGEFHFVMPFKKGKEIFLTEKIANKKDPTIKDKYDFVENSYYVRVKINEAPNKNSVIKFQDIFCKLFITYNKEYNRIIDFYSMYIDSKLSC